MSIYVYVVFYITILKNYYPCIPIYGIYIYIYKCLCKENKLLNDIATLLYRNFQRKKIKIVSHT